MDISNDPKVLEWFGIIEAAESTQEIYTHYLKMFCECAKKTPAELVAESFRDIKEGKMPGERAVVGYVAVFKKFMADRDLADKTIGLGLAAVVSFFRTFDIVLSARVGKQRKRSALHENITYLTKEEVELVIDNCNNPREKAIVLLMATSGLARREIINLKVGDIEWDENGIGTISIRRQKSKVDFVTFTTPETKDALDNYFAIRNGNPTMKIKGPEDYLFINYRDGGKMKPTTWLKIFNNMAKRLKLTNGSNTGRKGLFVRARSHGFRKFFSNALEQAGCPMDKANLFLGHTRTDIDNAYFGLSAENILKLKEVYTRYIPYLTFKSVLEIHSLNSKDAARLTEVEKLLQKKEAETLELRQQLTEAKQNTLETTVRLETVGQEYRRVADRLERLEMQVLPPEAWEKHGEGYYLNYENLKKAQLLNKKNPAEDKKRVINKKGKK